MAGWDLLISEKPSVTSYPPSSSIRRKISYAVRDPSSTSLNPNNVSRPEDTASLARSITWKYDPSPSMYMSSNPVYDSNLSTRRSMRPSIIGLKSSSALGRFPSLMKPVVSIKTVEGSNAPSPPESVSLRLAPLPSESSSTSISEDMPSMKASSYPRSWVPDIIPAARSIISPISSSLRSGPL